MGPQLDEDNFSNELSDEELVAKSQNGDCLLRIEDTDKERSKDEYTTEIIESFKWLGVEFDNEVVYQSNNTDRYKEIIDQLLDQGSAYICKGEDLETDKKYRDQNLPRDNKTVVRFKMPEEGNTVYADIVKVPFEFIETVQNFMTTI